MVKHILENAFVAFTYTNRPGVSVQENMFGSIDEDLADEERTITKIHHSGSQHEACAVSIIGCAGDVAAACFVSGSGASSSGRGTSMG